MRLPPLLVSTLLLAGCSKPAPVPTCEQIVDNMLAVTKQLAGHGDMRLDRGEMLAQCGKRALTAAQRRCLATAKDQAALAACVPRKAPPAPARPAPTTAPPPPAGSAAP